MAIDQKKLDELIENYREVSFRWQELLETESRHRDMIKPDFAKDQGAELREALREWAVESGERAKQTVAVEELKEAERKLFFYVLNNTEDPVTEAEMRLIVEDYAERITYLKKNYLYTEEELAEMEEKKKGGRRKSTRKTTKKKDDKKKDDKKDEKKETEKTAKKSTKKDDKTEKKAPAKKTTAKKSTAKKSTAKKSTAKKTAAKKDDKKADEKADK